MSDQTIENSKEQFEKIAELTGEKLGNMAAEFSGATTDYVKSGHEYVKENPVKTIAIAAAVGILAGSLLTMALRSRD